MPGAYRILQPEGDLRLFGMSLWRGIGAFDANIPPWLLAVVRVCARVRGVGGLSGPPSGIKGFSHVCSLIRRISENFSPVMTVIV
jgi:hypothetical protein